MKKTALSLLVVAASGAYVWHQAGSAVTVGLLAATPPDSVALAGNIGKRSQTLVAAAPATGTTPTIPTALTKAPAAKEDKTESIALPSNEPLPPPPAMLAVPKPTVTPQSCGNITLARGALCCVA